MIRKTVFLLLILTGIIPFACCPESPEGPYKLQLFEVTLLNSDFLQIRKRTVPNYVIPANDTYTGDTLLIGPNFIHGYAAQKSGFSLHASALALSCDDYPRFTYLQDKISSVEVFSNSDFEGVEAGELLNGKLLVYSYSRDEFMSLQQVITNLNTLNFNDNTDPSLGALMLTEKPLDNQPVSFTVRIRYESGIEESATSYPVSWQ